MKITILTISVAFVCLLTACSKKSDSNTPSDTLQVEVSGLTAKTSVSIQITNQKNITVLSVVNQFGNKTYNTDKVYSKDQLRIHYSANMKSDLDNNGVGTIKFLYKGQNIGASGGDLGGPTGNDRAVIIP
jgi:hypothetical protein